MEDGGMSLLTSAATVKVEAGTADEAGQLAVLGGMADEAGRLVDDQQVVVFKNDVEHEKD
jgi:hypothetical protein